jgi:hypothetical protein
MEPNSAVSVSSFHHPPPPPPHPPPPPPPPNPPAPATKSILLEGTQAIPARPSDKDGMGVKMLGWWVVGGGWWVVKA